MGTNKTARRIVKASLAKTLFVSAVSVGYWSAVFRSSFYLSIGSMQTHCVVGKAMAGIDAFPIRGYSGLPGFLDPQWNALYFKSSQKVLVGFCPSQFCAKGLGGRPHILIMIMSGQCVDSTALGEAHLLVPHMVRRLMGLVILAQKEVEILSFIALLLLRESPLDQQPTQPHQRIPPPDAPWTDCLPPPEP